MYRKVDRASADEALEIGRSSGGLCSQNCGLAQGFHGERERVLAAVAEHPKASVLTLGLEVDRVGGLGVRDRKSVV